MRWKTDIPRFLTTRKWRKPETRSRCTTDRAHHDRSSLQVALQLTVRGDAIDITALQNPGRPHAAEELARGYDPSRVAVILDTLTSESPSLWFAAVERDVRFEVEVVGPGSIQSMRFRTTIRTGTIVPMRALFDNAQIAMVSGCSIDLRLLDGSGPIRIFRKTRRLRRRLH